MGLDPLTKFLQETLVLDTETTSLIHKEAEIIQYASADVLHVLGTIASEAYDVPNSFHQPEKSIPPEISTTARTENHRVGCLQSD